MSNIQCDLRNRQRGESMKKFYMMHRENSGYTKVQHRTFNDAFREAERLAKLNPGDNFFILEAISVVKGETKVTTTLLTGYDTNYDDVPF